MVTSISVSETWETLDTITSEAGMFTATLVKLSPVTFTVTNFSLGITDGFILVTLGGAKLRDARIEIMFPAASYW